MSGPQQPLASATIAATNVRPAYEASLTFGATEAELEVELGWNRAMLEGDGAVVSADSTYAHLELMHTRPRYAEFVLAAVRSVNLSSLGVVGLACRTVATVGEAIACHARFQHLTNRTARYTSRVNGDHFVVIEERDGASRLGRALVSDYALFVIVQLLRASSDEPVPLRTMNSRSESLSDEERALFERFVGVPIALRADHASLTFDRALLDAPVPSADPELANYFARVLERACDFPPNESPLRQKVRLAIRDGAARGAATLEHVAHALKMGRRTLQRRLTDEGTTFAQMLESTLEQLADGYLADDTLSLTEIAYLLGYQEQSSFYRAFRRWHDCTPAEYRARR